MLIPKVHLFSHSTLQSLNLSPFALINQLQCSSTMVPPMEVKFPISHFTGILRVLLRSTPQYTKHSSYTYRISLKFCVLLMLRKIIYEILWCFARMPTLAQNGAKGEKNDAKCEKSVVKYNAMQILFCLFCENFMLFSDKCIVSLRKQYRRYQYFFWYWPKISM